MVCASCCDGARFNARNPPMKLEFTFIPMMGPLCEADAMPLNEQDAIRRLVPASTMAYQDGHLLLSREGVLHLKREIIAGHVAGNRAAAVALRDEILKAYPE